jgi:hypothetical protein
VFCGCWTRSIFKNLFQKKWFVALLLILLAAETVILVTVLVEWSFQNQAFPSISVYPPMQPQCYALTPLEMSRDQYNRTVLFNCRGTAGKGPALKAASTLFEGPASYPHYSQVAPSFSLPKGYQELLLTYTGDCTDRNSIALTSGHRISVSDDRTYSYCAVISISAGRVDSFTVRWYSQPYVPCCALSASPSQITIQNGQFGYVTILVTSLGTFSGNVSLNYYLTWLSGSHYTYGLYGSFKAASLFLKAGGSNSTVLTLAPPTGDTGATYRVDIIIYPADYASSRTSFTVIVT